MDAQCAGVTVAAGLGRRSAWAALTVNGFDSCCSVVVARMASLNGPDAVGPLALLALLLLLLLLASADMAAGEWDAGADADGRRGWMA